MFQPKSDGPQMMAARFAFELKYGRKPQRTLIRTCGNKMCVRAEHMSDVIAVDIKPEPLPWTDQFCAKIQPPDENGCWIYGKHRDRYGVFTRGRHETAHRVSWEMYNGPIPKGVWILHHCDTKACVNPEHLYAGSPQDNANDRTRRGRHRLGQPLTEEEKSIILLSTAPTVRLARSLGRTFSTVMRFRKDPTRKTTRTSAGLSTSTHCVNGHEITPENTGRLHTGKTWCRPCNNAAKARYYARKTGKSA